MFETNSTGPLDCWTDEGLGCQSVNVACSRSQSNNLHRASGSTASVSEVDIANIAHNLGAWNEVDIELLSRLLVESFGVGCHRRCHCLLFRCTEENYPGCDDAAVIYIVTKIATAVC